MLNICGHALREDALVSTLSQAQYFLVIPSAVLLKTESSASRARFSKCIPWVLLVADPGSVGLQGGPRCCVSDKLPRPQGLHPIADLIRSP